MNEEIKLKRLIYQDPDNSDIEYEIYVQVNDVNSSLGEKDENQDLYTNDDGSESLSSRRDTAQKIQELAIADMQKASKMMRGYANFAINSFRKMGAAEVSEIMLEFSLKFGGKAGVFIAQTSTDSTLKVQVKCKFPESRSPKPEQDQ
jgi:hypothetical protein